MPHRPQQATDGAPRGRAHGGRRHRRAMGPAARAGAVAVACGLVGLLAGCAAPGTSQPNDVAASDTPGATTPEQAFRSACLRIELPALMPQLGIHPRLRTRDDVAAAAQVACEARWRACATDPQSDACLRAQARYGLGTPGAAPAPAPGEAQNRALFEAAYRGRSDDVRRLLAEGAAPDARNAVGWTPLMIAAAERHRDTVVALLAARADPDLRNAFGRTALMFAAGYGDEAISALLLDAGANPNLVPSDTSGWTALMASAARGHSATVALLLRRGADVSLRARDGQTAADLARAQGHTETLRLLMGATRAGT